jgi:uncharacterized protein YycO
MGALFRIACLAVLVTVAGKPRGQATPRADIAVKTGDVVLQTSTSSRSALIRKASDSPYSHVGLIEVASDGVFVIEAVQPVSRTPWKAWRARGVGQKVTVLRATTLDDASLRKVVASARKDLGKPYDARYRWDDETLYCSELVAKAFERGAGLQVGTQQVVRSLHLSPADLALGPRLGVDPDQTLLTPASLAEDPRFVVVHTDFH